MHEYVRSDAKWARLLLAQCYTKKRKPKYFEVFTYLNLALWSPLKTGAELQKRFQEAMQSQSPNVYP